MDFADAQPTVVWSEGDRTFDVNTMRALQRLSRPPSVPKSSDEVGGDVVIVGDEEVQIFVCVGADRFLGVGVGATTNVGLARSMTRQAARKMPV